MKARLAKKKEFRFKKGDPVIFNGNSSWSGMSGVVVKTAQDPNSNLLPGADYQVRVPHLRNAITDATELELSRYGC